MQRAVHSGPWLILTHFASSVFSAPSPGPCLTWPSSAACPCPPSSSSSPPPPHRPPRPAWAQGSVFMLEAVGHRERTGGSGHSRRRLQRWSAPQRAAITTYAAPMSPSDPMFPVPKPAPSWAVRGPLLDEGVRGASKLAQLSLSSVRLSMSKESGCCTGCPAAAPTPQSSQTWR